MTAHSLMAAGLGGVLAICLGNDVTAERVPTPASAPTLTSAAFLAGGELPSRFTCEGLGVSPPLAWHGVPAGAKSLVLIEEDPDAPDPAAPTITWSHWLLYNLPPASQGLPEGVVHDALPPGTREGRNDWKRTGYGAPCPPIGRHRYIHKLYALDVLLADLAAPDRRTLESAMRGHVIAQAELVGTYRKHVGR